MSLTARLLPPFIARRCRLPLMHQACVPPVWHGPWRCLGVALSAWANVRRSARPWHAAWASPRFPFARPKADRTSPRLPSARPDWATRPSADFISSSDWAILRRRGCATRWADRLTDWAPCFVRWGMVRWRLALGAGAQSMHVRPVCLACPWSLHPCHPALCACRRSTTSTACRPAPRMVSSSSRRGLPGTDFIPPRSRRPSLAPSDGG